jgi:hypothetical protein
MFAHLLKTTGFDVSTPNLVRDRRQIGRKIQTLRNKNLMRRRQSFSLPGKNGGERSANSQSVVMPGFFATCCQVAEKVPEIVRYPADTDYDQS